jgi:hypothetical protein
MLEHMLWTDQFLILFRINFYHPKSAFRFSGFLSRLAFTITTRLNPDLHLSSAEFESQVPVPEI